MGERYRHITWNDRLRIEARVNVGYSVQRIAEDLGFHISTVYRELKRGRYTHLNSDLTTEERYSPDIAEARYQEGLSAKGAPIKLGKNRAAAAFIEKMIAEEHYSPAAVCALLRDGEHEELGITFCRQTIYKYIDDGVFLTLTKGHLPEKGQRKRSGGRVRPRQKRESAGTSIEERPKEANERRTPGHWEMDTIAGRKRTRARLLVLSERVTRRAIIIRIKDGKAETVRRALDRLERIYGEAFGRVFRSITVDNGSEFADAEGLERSARRKGEKRTRVYYCHAYSAWERGTNENINRMIRRHFPKGTDFGGVSTAEVRRVERWVNSYPREILGFESAERAFERAFGGAA